jgi:GNAT superfamily N-acetyltransferase
MLAQDQRIYALDHRVRTPRTAEQARAFIADHRAEGQPLVARDATGRVRGYACATLRETPADHFLLAFFAVRTGGARSLTLPAPTEPDAQAVAEALLGALFDQWRLMDAGGAFLVWPACDPWTEPLFHAAGFMTDNMVASRALGPLPPMSRPDPVGVQTRLARPADEETLVALHLEEIAFHLPYHPFLRLTPALETAFRAGLAEVWNGESVEDGAPLIVVAEHDGEVVGMSENYLQVSPASDNYFAPLRYGYLNSMGVRADRRGQGIGRCLVDATLAAFMPYAVDQYYLIYMAHNPIASRVWPHLGFQPVLSRYQWRKPFVNLPLSAYNHL